MQGSREAEGQGSRRANKPTISSSPLHRNFCTSAPGATSTPQFQLDTDSISAACTTLKFDFNIDACGQVELHESINGFRGRLININNSPMGASLEVFPRIFVHVGRSQQTVYFPRSWQGNRTNSSGVSAISSIDNFLARGIE